MSANPTIPPCDQSNSRNPAMRQTPAITASPEGVQPSEDLSPQQLRELFCAFCRALTFDALRLRPREKQFALLLAVESFGYGRESGAVDVRAWRNRLVQWRSNEVRDMLDSWRRAGWLMLDEVGEFRLAPDRLPGWADVVALRAAEGNLPLRSEDDLNKMIARVSQSAAAPGSCARPECDGVAKISQTPARSCENFANSGGLVAKISHLGGKGGNVSETFNRSDVKRLNVQRSDAREACENFANPVLALRERVRKFVGETDWANENFWNHGTGWRAQVFLDESRELERALNYCEAGLSDTKSGITIKTTKGAMLWDQFQRERRARREKEKR